MYSPLPSMAVTVTADKARRGTREGNRRLRSLATREVTPRDKPSLRLARPRGRRGGRWRRRRGSAWRGAGTGRLCGGLEASARRLRTAVLRDRAERGGSPPYRSSAKSTARVRAERAPARRAATKNCSWRMVKPMDGPPAPAGSGAVPRTIRAGRAGDKRLSRGHACVVLEDRRGPPHDLAALESSLPRDGARDQAVRTPSWRIARRAVRVGICSREGPARRAALGASLEGAHDAGDDQKHLDVASDRLFHEALAQARVRPSRLRGARRHRDPAPGAPLALAIDPPRRLLQHDLDAPVGAILSVLEAPRRPRRASCGPEPTSWRPDTSCSAR